MTRVIKIGGRPQLDPSLAGLVADSCEADPGATMIVHGGGDEISALQRAFGLTPSFVDGRRVTTDADIDIVRMALSGLSNKRLVAALADRGVKAVGLSGEDGGLIEARPVDNDKLGHVGTPARINGDLLRSLLDGGFVPVISPLARGINAGSGALNVNGDDAAAAIAVDVGADELLLIVDVAGVLQDGQVLAEVDAPAARRMLDDGSAAGGMRAKLQAALLAANGGVARVRIGDLRAIADSTAGTLIRGVS